MPGQEFRDRFVKHTNVEFHIVGHLRQFRLREGTDRITVPVLWDSFKGIKAMYRTICVGPDPANRLTSTNPELEIQTRQAGLSNDVLDQLRMLLKIWRVGHILRDVLQCFLFRVELQIDQQIRAIVLQHKSPKEEFTKGTFE